MAKPNYAYQKRQKEIAKKKKKEEKLLQKTGAAGGNSQDIQPESGTLEDAEAADDNKQNKFT